MKADRADIGPEPTMEGAPVEWDLGVRDEVIGDDPADFLGRPLLGLRGLGDGLSLPLVEIGQGEQDARRGEALRDGPRYGAAWVLGLINGKLYDRTERGVRAQVDVLERRRFSGSRPTELLASEYADGRGFLFDGCGKQMTVGP